MTRSQFAVALAVLVVASLAGGVLSHRLLGSQEREGAPGAYELQGVPGGMSAMPGGMSAMPGGMSAMPGLMAPVAQDTPHGLFLLDTRIGTVWSYRWDSGAKGFRWTQLPRPPDLD